MPPFKDEHVLVIAPGSQITQTQLGLPETFTPPRWRFPTRMFPGPKNGEWEPVFIRERVKPKEEVEPKVETNGALTNGHVKDVEMVDVPSAPTEPVPSIEANGAAPQPPESVAQDQSMMETLPTDSSGAVQPAEPQPDATTSEEQETEFYDDPLTIANAVYPIKAGRIENWPCFFALLSHIYNMISPPFHMPVLVVAQPCWTARDKEWITQYFFENWKIPALCVMDSALAATWGFGVQTACVVDVGEDKCDVTAVTDYVVNEIGRGVAIEGCGGSAMTERIKEELEKNKEKYAGVENFWDLAEQIKRSYICEILPAGAPLPGQTVENMEKQSTVSLLNIGGDGRESMTNNMPAKAEDGEAKNGEEDHEGVLDVASIVAQSNAAEVLAKREREKAERDAKRKVGAAEASRQIRLRNAEKLTATLRYEEFIAPEESSTNGVEAAASQSRKRKRDVEVGLERFQVASPSNAYSESILERIASAVHGTIMGVPDVPARSHLWDNLIVLGNGSRVRGFTSALMHTLSSKYTLSPSTATIFTSELPSNFSTPVPTGGTNTPIPGQHSHASAHVGSGVNPLLVAATKNMMQPGAGHHLQVPGQQHYSHNQLPGMDPSMHHSYRGYTQTPTSMKTVKPPEYFPEWKDPSVAGMEDAAFLGAQTAAKVVFIVDQGISKGFLTRSEYNDMGPEGIHTCAM